MVNIYDVPFPVLVLTEKGHVQTENFAVLAENEIVLCGHIGRPRKRSVGGSMLTHNVPKFRLAEKPLDPPESVKV
jgi:hypothetical protein